MRFLVSVGWLAAGLWLMFACGAKAAEEAASAGGAKESGAPEHYVAPGGREENPGTKEAPWDIVSALEGRQKVAPGSTVWLRGGTYRHPDRRVDSLGYFLRLQGAPGAPIQVRGVPGERATIDGGLQVAAPATHVWLRDLEITVSEANRISRTLGRTPGADLGRPHGGLHISSGAGCKFINLVVHGSRAGVPWWVGSTDSEVYGCLIYDIGWQGPDRGHGGHHMYTQNKDGVKTVSDCVFTGQYEGVFSMHAYGSKRASVDNYLVTNNIAYNTGAFLVGGEGPGRGNKVLDNCFYNVHVRVGYTGKGNRDGEVRGNVVVNGNLDISNYESGAAKGNVIVGGELRAVDSTGVAQENNETVPGDAAARRDPLVVLRPNRYDPDRAHLAVYNWRREPTVLVDASGFLKDGETFRLVDPRQFYGDAVQWGFCREGKIKVWMYRQEFAAFVVFRNRTP